MEGLDIFNKNWYVLFGRGLSPACSTPPMPRVPETHAGRGSSVCPVAAPPLRSWACPGGLGARAEAGIRRLPPRRPGLVLRQGYGGQGVWSAEIQGSKPVCAPCEAGTRHEAGHRVLKTLSPALACGQPCANAHLAEVPCGR